MSRSLLIYVCFATLCCVSSLFVAKPGLVAGGCGRALTSELSCQQVKVLGVSAMTFCLQISLPSVLWLALIETALSSNVDVNILQKIWMLKKPLGSGWLFPEQVL